MNIDVLSAAGLQIEDRHGHLYNLLDPEEIECFEAELLDGERPVWRYWQKYVTKTLALGKSPVTIRGVRDSLKIVIRHTGLCSIEKLNTPGLLDEALLRLQIERNQKPSTRNSYIKAVNTYFIWLYRNHFVDVNNIARIERGREIPPDVVPLTLDQIQRTVVHINTRKHTTTLERARNILVIDILRFSGIRPCELVDMRMSDIYSEGGAWKMLVNGRKQKGRKRYYEVPSFLVHSFQTYLKLREDAGRFEEPLLISMTSRKGWTTCGLQGLFKKLSRELGFRITAYGFRRFIASHLNRLGIPRDHLSRYMGHSNFSTTELYIARDCFLTQRGTNLLRKTYSKAIR